MSDRMVPFTFLYDDLIHILVLRIKQRNIITACFKHISIHQIALHINVTTRPILDLMKTHRN